MPEDLNFPSGSLLTGFKCTQLPDFLFDQQTTMNEKISSDVMGSRRKRKNRDEKWLTSNRFYLQSLFFWAGRNDDCRCVHRNLYFETRWKKSEINVIIGGEVQYKSLHCWLSVNERRIRRARPALSSHEMITFISLSALESRRRITKIKLRQKKERV